MEELSKIVQVGNGEVAHNITSEISTAAEAKKLAKQILANLPQYDSYTGKFGLNKDGE